MACLVRLSTKGNRMTEITEALMKELVWDAIEDPNCGFDPEMLGTKLADALSDRKGETYRDYPRFVPVWGYVFDRKLYRRAIFTGENGAHDAAEKMNDGDAGEYVWEEYR